MPVVRIENDDRETNVTRKCIRQLGITIFAAAIISPLLMASAKAAGSWYPSPVDVWNPPFNKLLKRQTDNYVALDKAQRQWRICVSIPHLKDPYWAAVNFGLIDEAKRLGVALRIVEAGGYGHLDVQRRQITECMGSGAQSLIISAISATGLNDLVEKYAAEGKPVIDMINGISSEKITARTGVDFWDTGFKAAEYIRALTKGSSKDIQVAWFPGPAGAVWVSRGDKGFRDALKGSRIKIVASANGDTGKGTQSRLVKSALAAHPNLDFIVGTTVTANAAVELIRKKGLTGKIKVLSYYYGPGVHRGIRRGNIVAAPTDLQAVQARMSVDLAVRALEKKVLFKHVGPKVIVVDRKNIKSFDSSTSLPPRGFRPIFSINDWGK